MCSYTTTFASPYLLDSFINVLHAFILICFHFKVIYSPILVRVCAVSMETGLVDIRDG